MSATIHFARVARPAIRQAEGSVADRQSQPSPPFRARSDYAQLPMDATPHGVMRQAIRVSAPTDPAEREAEQVSARIMTMRLPEAGGGAIRQYATGTAARAPGAGATGAGATAPAPAPAARSPAASVAEPDVSEEIRALAGKGQKLPAAVIAFMAPRFKADFSQVTIDTSPRAARLAARLQARAFTFERTIFFGHDQFKPDSEEGRALIAHELTHTIQQRAVVQRQPDATVAIRTAPAIQRWGLSDVLEKFGDLANALPGFRLMTIVLGVNPITMEPVPRDAANLLRAVIEVMPGGSLITQALDQYGVIARAAGWLQAQFATLGVSAGSIKAALGQFIDSLGLSDALHLGDLWDRAKRIVTEPIARIGTFIGGLVEGLVTMVRDAILVPLANRAAETRGWTLLTAVLGRNPITGEAVPRNAETLIGGFMTLIGQEDVWQNIKQGNAVARCWAWFQTTLGELEGFVGRIPDLFLAALHALGIADLLTPVQAFLRVAGIFGGFAAQFIAWGGEKVWNLLQIVFDVVKPGALGYVKRTGAALKAILKNPMPFVANLVRAAKLGFTNFAGNIGTHLKTGLIDWLTGSLTGVYIPQAMTLAELGRFALSVLGITWSHIRGKIVKALGPQGEAMMKSLETGFDIVVALVKGGLSAAWALIAAQLAALRDMVLDGIIGFVTDTIIGKAIPKLIAMFIPGAGFISAILSIYDTVMVFVEKLSKIAAAVAAFVDSIIAIAAGQVDAAANKVERTLAGLLSLAISFLAGFIGLGNVAEKVMTVVRKVWDTIDKALDTAIGFVLGKAKAFLAKLFAKGDAKVASPGKAGASGPIDPMKASVDLAGEAHEITLRMVGGQPQLFMASANPRSLTDAIKSVLGSSERRVQDALRKDGLRETLLDIQSEVKRIEAFCFTHMEELSRQNVSYNVATVQQVRIMEGALVQVVRELGTKYRLKELSDIGHSSRYVVNDTLLPEFKGNVRRIFYAVAWDGAAESFKERELVRLNRLALEAKPALKLLPLPERSKFYLSVDRSNKVGPPAVVDRRDKNCEPQLDHVDPLGRRWKETGKPAPGNNTIQADRVKDYLDPDNLQVLAGWMNVQKGGDHFVEDVGPGFRGPNEG
jgi:hypothetical protein